MTKKLIMCYKCGKLILNKKIHKKFTGHTEFKQWEMGYYADTDYLVLRD